MISEEIILNIPVIFVASDSPEIDLIRKSTWESRKEVRMYSHLQKFWSDFDCSEIQAWSVWT